MAARVAVAGGGLSGLACGALLARGGAQVTVFEGGPGLGGMAATQMRDGYLWNWGGHALYSKGAGVPVLRELGVHPDGLTVRAASYMEILRDGLILPAPFSPKGSFGRVLDAAEQLELGKVFAALPAARRDDLASVPFGEWLDAHARRPRVREIVLALVRLSTFVHNPVVQSADAAVGQLWLSLSGVWYLHGWAQRAVPVKAATWELSLRRQPPGSVWVLGADVPVYVNVHSHFARVAPPGAAMVHVVRYLGPERPDPAHRTEMECALDQALPGWRDELVDDRFLPALTVTHDHPCAANGGLPGRPGPLVDDVDGLAVVGDWVGARGLLADAVLASADTAARVLAKSLARSSEALV